MDVSTLTAMDWWTITGTVVGVGALAVSIWVLVVAQGAREAAQAAQAFARRRDLVEELEGASEKIQQVGHFIQEEEWVPVRMRTEEILRACQTALSRWPDHLSEGAKNDVLGAIALMHSIAQVIAGLGAAAVSVQQKRKLSDAHMRASGHISSVLGEARRGEERNGDVKNAD